MKISNLSILAILVGVLSLTTAPVRADEQPVGKTKGWDINKVSGQGKFRYCAADKDNTKVQLRIAHDGTGWSIGMPYYSDGKLKGSWGFDGLEDQATFVSDDDGWAFMKVSKAMRKSLRQQDSLALELDRGEQIFDLKGVKAAMKAVRNCVRASTSKADDESDDGDDDAVLAAPLKKTKSASAETAVTSSAAHSDDDVVTNIANNRTFVESVYGDTRGWTVYSGRNGKRLAYCTGEMPVADTKLRLGYDKGQWQIAFPNAASTEWEGSLEVDGDKRDIGGASDGKWTFVWLGLEDLDRIRNGSMMIVDVGKASIDFELAGTAAVITKVEECLARNGRTDASTSEMPLKKRDIKAKADTAVKAQRMSNGLFEHQEQTLGDWSIYRYTNDASGRDTDHCMAIKMQDSEMSLRFAFSRDFFDYGFMGPGTGADPKAIKVKIWFDDDPESESTAMADLAIAADGSEWRSYSQSTSDGPGMEDAFMNSKQANVSYVADGSEHVEVFSLKGANTALKSLFDCVNEAP